VVLLFSISLADVVDLLFHLLASTILALLYCLGVLHLGSTASFCSKAPEEPATWGIHNTKLIRAPDCDLHQYVSVHGKYHRQGNRGGGLWDDWCYFCVIHFLTVSFHHLVDGLALLQQTPAYVEYFVVNSSTFLLMFICYTSTIVSMRRKLRKGQRLSKAHRTVVFRFVKVIIVAD